MFIPIGTDVQTRRPPYGNWALVGLNVVVFMVFGAGSSHPQLQNYMLNAAVPTVGQYITYQFLHGDIMHLAGNMLFLWIFGNAVCDRMGSVAYVLFYLAGGVIAGAVFAAYNDNPLLGASGAIAAVTTAFLVLFPRVHVRMLLLFIVITTIQIPAMVLIVFKIILWDNVIAPGLDRGMNSSVAHSAHLGGYAFGFIAALLLLASRALPRTQFDLLSIWGRWSRRQGIPVDAIGGGLGGRARPIRVEEGGSRPIDALPVSAAEQLREDIVDLVQENDLAEATRLYLRLREEAPGIVLPMRAQLAVANQLHQSQRPAAAAAAYEDLLAAYPAMPDSGQVRLLLGIIFHRYLHDDERAAEHLRRAISTLALEPQRRLAEEELSAVLARGAGPAGEAAESAGG